MTSAQLQRLEARLLHGDDAALGEAFALLQPRLAQTIRLRMDQRMVGRIDADDVVQESFLVASRRLSDYREKVECSLPVWLRTIAMQVLIDASRFHLLSKCRSQNLEIPLRADSGQTRIRALACQRTSPTHAAARRELNVLLQEKLGGMSDLDREILILRHFEELSNNEVAEVLGIHKAAATNRYLRALRRLKPTLSSYQESKEKTGS